MTAGLGCGTVFLPLGKGRNDWLYNISYSSNLLPVDLILNLFLCLKRRNFTCVVGVLSDPMIT